MSDFEIISIEGELNAIVRNIYGSLNNYFKQIADIESPFEVPADYN